MGNLSDRLRRLRANAVRHDLLLVAFHAWILIWSTAGGADSPDGLLGRRMALALFAITGLTVLLVRADVLPAGAVRGAVYRLVLITSLPVSYYAIACSARAMQPELFDQQLWAIDRVLFGVTPAAWLERLNRRDVIEWFAFFYQSYYPLLVAFLYLPAFLDRGVRLQEFLFAAAMAGVLGHTGYTLVPGVGPYRAMPFSEAVQGGYWWSVVQETVRAERALDIFPSMHTAMPTVFTLHLYRHRRHAPFKYLWPVMGFFTANIIVATMLLRWHWGIDIVAGLALAGAAHLMAVRVARRERSRGRADRRQLVWEPVFPWQRGRLGRADVPVSASRSDAGTRDGSSS